MTMSMTSLLIHSEGVPTSARTALHAANSASPERRVELLRSAARILHDEVGVPCADVRELLDLPADHGCG
jgi:hypothetical protein